MTTKLNRLERMGWEKSAQVLLDIRRSEAAMLASLVVDHPGSLIAFANLAELTGRTQNITAANLTVSSSMCRVRQALVDVGFPGDAVQTLKGLGYLVPSRWAGNIDAAIRAGCMVDIEVSA